MANINNLIVFKKTKTTNGTRIVAAFTNRNRSFEFDILQDPNGGLTMFNCEMNDLAYLGWDELNLQQIALVKAAFEMALAK